MARGEARFVETHTWLWNYKNFADLVCILHKYFQIYWLAKVCFNYSFCIISQNCVDTILWNWSADGASCLNLDYWNRETASATSFFIPLICCALTWILNWSVFVTKKRSYTITLLFFDVFWLIMWTNAKLSMCSMSLRSVSSDDQMQILNTIGISSNSVIS